MPAEIFFSIEHLILPAADYFLLRTPRFSSKDKVFLQEKTSQSYGSYKLATATGRLEPYLASIWWSCGLVVKASSSESKGCEFDHTAVH